MIDIDRPWVIDDLLSTRYPVYTRGNVEEVTPDVISPLQWTAFAGPVSEHAWKRALAAPRTDLEEDAGRARKLRLERPDLGRLSDRELLARYQAVIDDDYGPVLTKHFLLVYESALAAGLLGAALEPLVDDTLRVRLISGWGNVASAAPAAALWALGRRVAESAELGTEFDGGAERLLDRLRARSEPPFQAFARGFEDFLVEFGSRATQEYEAMPQTWETHPSIPLGIVDRLRLQPADRDPGPQTARLARERRELAGNVRARLAGTARETFDTALRAVELYMPAREQSKATMVRLLHEARLPLREIASRQVALGNLNRVEDIIMLTLDEVGELIDKPSSRVDLVAERWEWLDRLQELEPPYIIDGTVPPVSTWPRRTASVDLPVAAGDVLAGVGACPGTATGRARIIDDPAQARELQPGEVLVAPETDPGWTPLFLTAAAVVVNAGNQLSHAAIVSRELGIPRVLAVEGATRRIADSTLLTVDETTGKVTVH